MGLIISSLLPLLIIETGFAATAYAQTTAKSPCNNPQVLQMKKCYLNVNVDRQCKSAILRFLETVYTKAGYPAEIFWNHPMSDFSAVNDTPFTATRQPHALRLETQPLKSEISRDFQVQNNGFTSVLPLQFSIITV